MQKLLTNFRLFYTVELIVGNVRQGEGELGSYGTLFLLITLYAKHHSPYFLALTSELSRDTEILFRNF